MKESPSSDRADNIRRENGQQDSRLDAVRSDTVRSDTVRSDTVHSDNSRSGLIRLENFQADSGKPKDARKGDSRADNTRSDNVRSRSARAHGTQTGNAHADKSRANSRADGIRLDGNRSPLYRRGTVLLFSFGAMAATVILCCLFLLSGRQKDFLSSSDYEFITSYLAGEERKEITSFTEAFVGENLTPFEEREEVEKALSDSLSPSRLSVSRDGAYTPDAPIYTVYSDGKEILTVALKSAGKTKTGFEKWKIESVGFSSPSALKTDLAVEVPHGAVLTVNGQEAGESLRLPETVNCPALSEFEQSLSSRICCDRYELGSFFLSPDVSAVLEGYRLRQPLPDKDGVLRFSYPAAYISTLLLTVPQGATVKVNGLPVPDSYVTGNTSYPFLSRYEATLSDVALSRVYQLSGLFEEPTVEVEYGGVLLSPEEGSGLYRLPEDSLKKITVVAPDYASVKLNGIPLSHAEITSEGADLPLLEGVTSYAKKRPHLVEYTVTGLFRDPTVTAVNAEGSALATDGFRTTEDRIFFLHTTEPGPPDKDTVTLRSFARYYVSFLYGGGANLNANYSRVTDMTPSSSQAFTKLKAQYSTLRNSPAGKNITYGDPVYRDYAVIASSAYSCTVVLPYSFEREGTVEEGTLTMEILYVFSGSIRRVVNFIVH